MSLVTRSVYIICAIVVLALGSCRQNADEGRRSFKSLTQAYRQAHDGKDIDALIELVYLGEGPSAKVNLVESKKGFELDLNCEIQRIYRKRLDREDRDRQRHATLKPLGLMHIEWVTKDPNSEYHSIYCYGETDGIYYITGTGPGMVEEQLKVLSEGEAPDSRFPGAKEGARLALSQWQNDKIDDEPILFWAAFTKSVDSLVLDFFDEEMNVIGFGIEESYVGPNGVARTLVERYPVFAHFQWSDVEIFKIVPIQVRDAGQCADKERWDHYLNDESIDPNVPMTRDEWTKSLPPVWVSIPDPEALDVSVYVYDRTGNRSASVKLISPTQND